MYKIIVIEDEPASQRHICNIIKDNCPDFEVADTARNGRSGLDKVKEQQPDVVITDVMMPVMNGIEVVSELKRSHPQILSVIVSGYNDFEYAKAAIQSGVSEYLLKPVRPSDVRSLLKRLGQILDERFYTERKEFLSFISRGMQESEAVKLKRLFPEPYYYAAVYRKNGLMSRFSKGYTRDMFSMPEEKVIIYGRDEMEALYLCPEGLLNNENFLDYFSRTYQKVKEKNAFYTAVIRENRFTPEEFPMVMNELYRTLDENIVIGTNQLVLAGSVVRNPEKCDGENFELLEHYVRIKDGSGIKKEIHRLFQIWIQNRRPQVWLEEKINYLFSRLLEKGYITEYSQFVMDDLFAEVISMEELEGNIIGLLSPGDKRETLDDKREEEYCKILSYLEEFIHENISARLICKKFAMSQSTLSKLFHAYGDTSFSVYLTNMRMEKARQIMQRHPEILIRDVAEGVGYHDQFYFSRVFRSAVGVSPSEYLDSQMRKKEVK